MVDTPSEKSRSSSFSGPLLASRRHTVIFLAILAAVAAWGVASQQRFGGGAPTLSPGAKWAAYASVVALQILLVRYVAIGIHRKGMTLRDLLGDVSTAPRRVMIDLLLAVGFLAAARVLSPLLGAALGGREDVGRVIGPSGPAQVAAWILVSLAAGIGEEISFRGYLQGQFARMTSSLPAAILLQAAAFAVPHMYQGWRAALGTGIYGLAFGVLAAARKSLRPGILAHALVDVVGGITSG
ncbi:MAG TPA: CPBP family intramembrane glutamic endopeptidase [Thermoanaerobaculia bacterium]|nr:CPBP family intramembrane glutamic endopeptidase [Thermoanaerobaculia bacterium]